MRALAYGFVAWAGLLSGIAVFRLARFEHDAMNILHRLSPGAVASSSHFGSVNDRFAAASFFK